MRLSQILGLALYGVEGGFAGYLLLAPILRGIFGMELLQTLISWALAIGSLAIWWAVFRKESRERARGKLPPFSGDTPRLAIIVLLFGAILGSTLAVVFR
jgi:hypothetical protein